jgi:GNAT superfamily N-acetyltransferase
MRRTLEEVIGPEGRRLYSAGWLRDRVRFHLDRSRALGAVWLAAPPSQHSIGHIIARIEEEDGPLGLVSTIYVAPSWRRQGVAQALITRAEDWLIAKGAYRLATDTAENNAPLINLFSKFRYRIVFHAPENHMVRLERAIR